MPLVDNPHPWMVAVTGASCYPSRWSIIHGRGWNIHPAASDRYTCPHNHQIRACSRTRPIAALSWFYGKFPSQLIHQPLLIIYLKNEQTWIKTFGRWKLIKVSGSSNFLLPLKGSASGEDAKSLRWKVRRKWNDRQIVPIDVTMQPLFADIPLTRVGYLSLNEGPTDQLLKGTYTRSLVRWCRRSVGDVCSICSNNSSLQGDK